MNSHAKAILRSARIAELKMAAGLVKPRPRVELPPNAQRRAMCLRILLAAEPRRKYEALNEAWLRRHREFGDTMLAMAGVLCDAIKIGVRDVETIDQMGRTVQAGLARLHAINTAAEADRDPEMPLN
jgi:hypothetical protein